MTKKIQGFQSRSNVYTFKVVPNTLTKINLARLIFFKI